MTLGGVIINDITLKGWTLADPEVVTTTSILLAYNILSILVVVSLGVLKKNMWVVKK